MNTDKIFAEAMVNEYSNKSAAKVVALKKLDQTVKLPALIVTYTLGIVSALVAGTGMCLSMQVIGNGSIGYTVLGIVIGLLGFAGMCVNYPIYKRFLQNRKAQYAGDIIRLATEISQESEA